jgi:ribonuclease VapC
MVIDTSAVVAWILREPEAPEIERLAESSEVNVMSASTSVELAVVAQRSLSIADAARTQRFLRAYEVDIVDFTPEQALIAARAHQLYGRGTGHLARLNFGDCFSYALAIARDEPLLYVGDDFSHTDITPALGR